MVRSKRCYSTETQSQFFKQFQKKLNSKPFLIWPPIESVSCNLCVVYLETRLSRFAQYSHLHWAHWASSDPGQILIQLESSRVFRTCHRPHLIYFPIEKTSRKTKKTSKNHYRTFFNLDFESEDFESEDFELKTF